MKINIVEGNLLNQKVEVIVNAWNRNILPWWLLIPQGVSRAIKKRAGYVPFRELSKEKMIPLGGAVLTTAGDLPYKGIIHVAGINLFWCATDYSITQSVKSAIDIVNREGFKSIAFPMIGAGTGNKHPKTVENLIINTLEQCQTDAEVVLVRYKNKRLS